MPKPPKINPKEKPSLIDTTPYADVLAKPFTATGAGVLVDSKASTPYQKHQGVTSFGNTLLQGTPGGANSIYKSANNRLLVAHPSGTGWTDVGPYMPEGAANTNTVVPIVPPVKNNTPNPIDKVVLPTQFGTAGTFNPNTGVNKDYNNKVVEPIVEQYKNGGIIGKLKGYANGGEIDPNEFTQSKSTNPLLSSAASSGANAVVPGAGTGIGIGLQGLDAVNANLSEIDPVTGKYKDKNKAYGAVLLNTAVRKLGPFGMLQTATDKDLSLGEKALSIGTGGISDLIKLKGNVDDAEANNMGLVTSAKQQQQEAQKRIQQQASLQKQLTDRTQGLANGGKIEGKGTGKSDSITAKVKEGSFIIPSENSATAETIRKVILKAPITKANLKQGDGEKVKLSNGEHLFTPKEVDKIESKGVNLDVLAPNAKQLNDDKQKLVHQKELLGFKGGGRITKRKNSTGNKSFDSELDKISEKEYVKTEDVDADIKRLNDLNDKNYSLYGKYDNEISNHIRELNKIKPVVKGYVNTTKGNSEMESEIESTKKFLKENGASDIDIMAYEGKVKGLKKQIFDYKKNDAKKEALNNILERKSKYSSESDKNELKTKAASFYNNKLIDATKNLELSKKNPQNYTKEQINKFKDDVENAKTKILDVNSAANEGGMKLVTERDLYRKLSNTLPNTETKKSNTLKAPIVKESTNINNPKNNEFNIPNINYLGGDSNKAITQEKTSNPIANNVNDAKSIINTTNTTGYNVTPPKKGQYPSPNIKNKATKEDITSEYLQPKDVTLPLNSGDVNDIKQDKTPIVPSEQIGYERKPSVTNGLKIGDFGDAAINAIPFAQTAFGLSQLKKQGKRPVDTLDEDSLKSIKEARSNLNLLNADAKFGFTPEEQAMINNDNQNLTNAQRYTAKSMSGGSAGNAINLERSAINNSFDRALKAKAANRQLMLEKQGIARDQQKYIDELVANKALKNRQLFADKANAWGQNQAAGSQLLGAGLQNLIGLQRYQDELSAMKNTQGIRNNAFNSLGQ